MPSVQCHLCGLVVNLERSERPPPWCPKCGADFKAVPAGAGSAGGAPMAPPGALAAAALRSEPAGQFNRGESVSRSPERSPMPVPPAPERLLLPETLEQKLSRVYYHKRCRKATVISGDDLVRLETPFRGCDGTFCCACKDFDTLDQIVWADTGENVQEYRDRLALSVPALRKMWLTGFCNAYVGALNLHLDSRGQPAAPPRPQPVDLSAHRPPPEVVALGEPECVFKTWGLSSPFFNSMQDPHSAFNRAGRGLVGLLCIAMAALFFYGVTQSQQPGRTVGVILGIIFAGMGLWLAAWPFLKRQYKPTESVLVYAFYRDALVFAQNNVWMMLRWDEICEFHGHRPGVPQGSLRTQDGREMPLYRPVTDPDGLFREVERRLSTRLLPRAQQAVEAGQTVAFGPVGVSKAGLTCNAKSIAWEQVDRVGVEVLGPGPTGGLHGIGLHLLIGTQGGLWAAEPFLPLPNRDLLVQLLERVKPSRVPLAITRVPEFFPPNESQVAI